MARTTVGELRQRNAQLEAENRRLARERQTWLDMTTAVLMLGTGVAQWLDAFAERARLEAAWLHGAGETAKRDAASLNAWIAEVLARKGQRGE